MKHRKALLSEEELLVKDKVHNTSKRASETREQTLHKQEQNRTHMIDKHNTYHLACAEGSALHCCFIIFIVRFVYIYLPSHTSSYAYSNVVGEDDSSAPSKLY